MVLQTAVMALDPVILIATGLGYLLTFKTKHRWWLVMVGVTAVYCIMWLIVRDPTQGPWVSIVLAPLITTSVAAGINFLASRS